ncbi:MAG: hypothetical protein IRZ16_02085 [Myxococcaceae bacterium]|nr:hypothetical protein [Myxococcaceae bacterium]
MAIVRRLLLFLAIGALVGVVIASFTAMQTIPWYNTAGSGQALCNCLETARDATQAVIRWQLIGAAIGGVAFLILGIVLTVRGRNRRRMQSEPSASAPTTPPPRM